MSGKLDEAGFASGMAGMAHDCFRKMAEVCQLGMAVDYQQRRVKDYLITMAEKGVRGMTEDCQMNG